MRPEDYDIKQDKKAVEVRAKVELIERALQRFCPFYCPYCQADIHIGKFVGKYDIAFWLEKQRQVDND